ncbi:MAG: hypothetical protein AAF485_03235 [Chloroflexota bacterium]
MTSQKEIIVVQPTILNLIVVQEIHLKPRRKQHALEEVRRQIADLVREQGYRVSLATTGNRLWVTDEVGRLIQMDVKVSSCQVSKGGKYRYQAYIGRHDADILVFIAQSDKGDHLFVIPMAEIAPRRNIAIWGRDPSMYAGRWKPYLRSWETLHKTIEATQTQDELQLSLFE